MLTDKPHRLLKVAEAVAYLGLPATEGAKTLYRLAEAGDITHIRLRQTMRTRIVEGRPQRYRKPGRIYFLAADLDAWLDSRRVVSHRVAATPEPPRPTPGPSLDVPAGLRRFS